MSVEHTGQGGDEEKRFHHGNETISPLNLRCSLLRTVTSFIRARPEEGL